MQIRLLIKKLLVLAPKVSKVKNQARSLAYPFVSTRDSLAVQFLSSHFYLFQFGSTLCFLEFFFPTFHKAFQGVRKFFRGSNERISSERDRTGSNGREWIIPKWHFSACWQWVIMIGEKPLSSSNSLSFRRTICNHRTKFYARATWLHRVTVQRCPCSRALAGVWHESHK